MARPTERRAIAVRGTVQGVGFRPFVYGLASRLELCGFVTNDNAGVTIEIEGDARKLDQFLAELSDRPPRLARIDQLSWSLTHIIGDRDFRIEPSNRNGLLLPTITPDVATCDACIAELFDPANRRYRYPFLNCTDCGPRLTIVTGVPYDRERTTMAHFVMCAACRAEYENPVNRRFHAQPTACPVCGPQLTAADSKGNRVEIADPLIWFAEALREGRIGALKGLGGYHLACDARDSNAVRELRWRKHREEKPFAVMVADLESAEALCEISASERALLCSPRQPIVLLRKRASIDLSDAVAPANPLLGVMLPYTPLHHLLMRELRAPLVMTSGNRADEPIAISEPEVFERLSGIADFFLTHNRPIHVRCDDSVTRIMGERESPIRRSRGDAPQPIALPVKCDEPILAVGGQLKGAFALGRDRQAIVSHHLGDLDEFEAYRAFEKDIALYERLFSIMPRYIAHDLHPDYASTHYAKERAAREGIQLIAVQHHHAHMASCMAEHGVNQPAIGVCFDGTGYGADGAVWGGEFLVGDFKQVERAAHLRYVPMPGGTAAIKQPWRMAISHLHDAGIELPALTDRIDAIALRTVRRMTEQRLNAPLTSSVGRLFDAVACIAGIRDFVSFEGQAAIQLETMATHGLPSNSYEFDIHRDVDSFVVDTRPLVKDVVRDVTREVEPRIIAAKFHAALVEIILAACQYLRADTGISTVVLSGGVFLNSILATAAEARLRSFSFLPLRHLIVPPNDGGLSLGQLAIAATQLSSM